MVKKFEGWYQQARNLHEFVEVAIPDGWSTELLQVPSGLASEIRDEGGEVVEIFTYAKHHVVIRDEKISYTDQHLLAELVDACRREEVSS